MVQDQQLLQLQGFMVAMVVPEVQLESLSMLVLEVLARQKVVAVVVEAHHQTLIRPVLVAMVATDMFVSSAYRRNQ